MSAKTSGSDATPGGWSWPDHVPAAEEEDTDTPRGPTPEQETPQPEDDQHAGAANEGQWFSRTCRICLEQVLPTFHPPSENLPGLLAGRGYVSYDSESGKLIRPCLCKGTQQYVHEDCLQTWRHSDRSYTLKPRYFECPTCGFKYRLAKLTWARYISSTATQLALTMAIFLVAVFFLGFVGDFIISCYLDPYDAIASLGEQDEYEGYHVFEEDAVSWIEHFLKGFASLGLLGFAKVFWSNPINWFSYRGIGVIGGGRRAGNAGRDRIANLSWVAIMVGISTVLFGVWKGVRVFSRRVLEKAGERVLDVQGEDETTPDDDNDDEHEPIPQPGNGG